MLFATMLAAGGVACAPAAGPLERERTVTRRNPIPKLRAMSSSPLRCVSFLRACRRACTSALPRPGTSARHPEPGVVEGGVHFDVLDDDLQTTRMAGQAGLDRSGERD